MFVQNILLHISTLPFCHQDNHLHLHHSGLSSKATLGLHLVLDLSCYKLSIVYQAIIVDIIILEDRVYQELQLGVLEIFLFDILIAYLVDLTSNIGGR